MQGQDCVRALRPNREAQGRNTVASPPHPRSRLLRGLLWLKAKWKPETPEPCWCSPVASAPGARSRAGGAGGSGVGPAGAVSTVSCKYIQMCLKSRLLDSVPLHAWLIFYLSSPLWIDI